MSSCSSMSSGTINSSSRNGSYCRRSSTTSAGSAISRSSRTTMSSISSSCKEAPLSDRSTCNSSTIEEESKSHSCTVTSRLPASSMHKNSRLFKPQLRSSLPKLNYVSPGLGVDRFSSSHPMIPKHYVPPWQLDMKNRARILQIAHDIGVKPWEGHVSYFLEGRERLNATCPVPYGNLCDQRSRRSEPIHSPLSKYNSSVLYYAL